MATGNIKNHFTLFPWEPWKIDWLLTTSLCRLTLTSWQSAIDWVGWKCYSEMCECWIIFMWNRFSVSIHLACGGPHAEFSLVLDVLVEVSGDGEESNRFSLLWVVFLWLSSNFSFCSHFCVISMIHVFCAALCSTDDYRPEYWESTFLDWSWKPQKNVNTWVSGENFWANSEKCHCQECMRGTADSSVSWTRAYVESLAQGMIRLKTL